MSVIRVDTAYHLLGNSRQIFILDESRRFSPKTEQKLLQIINSLPQSNKIPKDIFITFDQACLILRQNGEKVELLNQKILNYTKPFEVLNQRLDILQKKIFKLPPDHKQSYFGRTADLVYPFSDFSGNACMGLAVIDPVNTRQVFAALGIPSAIFTGPVAFEKAYNEVRESADLKDHSGNVLGTLNIYRSIAETLGGITTVPVRIFAMLPTLSKTAQIASSVFGNLLASFTVALFFIYVVISSYTIHRHGKFAKPIHAILRDVSLTSTQKLERVLQHLVKKLEITDHDLHKLGEKTLRKICDKLAKANDYKNQEIRQKLKKTPLKEGAEKFQSMALDWLNNNLQSKELSDKALFGGLTNRLANSLYFKSLKKQKQFNRFSGVTISKDFDLKKIRNALKDLAVGNTEKAEQLVQTWKSSSLQTKILHGSILAICLLGVGGFTAVSVASGGLIPLIAGAIVLAVSLGMTGVDLYFLHQSLKQGALSKNEKIMMALFSVVTVMSISAAVVFSAGLIPLLFTVTTGILWLSLYFYILIASYQFEKKRREKETERILRYQDK